MKATPGPSVSGRYFLPNEPLLWTKRMPAARVMSAKRMCPCRFAGGSDGASAAARTASPAAANIAAASQVREALNANLRQAEPPVRAAEPGLGLPQRPDSAAT